MAILERDPEVVRPVPAPAGRAPVVLAVLRQLGLLLVAAAVYFGVRSLTEGGVATAERNARWLVDLERGLGISVEREVQQLALGVDGVLPAVNTVYIWGHWPVIGAVLGWLAWRRREAFLLYRNALLLSGAAGMLLVALFPVAPPRLMDLGFLDTVTAHSEAYRVLQPPAFTNQYAAMPSFHVGWDLLVGLALVREAPWRWLRAAGVLLPVLMLVSVVVTGNHYLLDAVVGDALVLAALALARRLPRRGGAPGPAPRVEQVRQRAARTAARPRGVAARSATAGEGHGDGRDGLVRRGAELAGARAVPAGTRRDLPGRLRGGRPAVPRAPR